MKRIIKIFPKVGGEIVIDEIGHSLTINIELEDGDSQVTLEAAIIEAAAITSRFPEILTAGGIFSHWNDRVVAVNAPRDAEPAQPEQASSVSEPSAKPKGAPQPASAANGVLSVACPAIKKIQAQSGLIGLAFVDLDGEDLHKPALKMFNTQFNAKRIAKLVQLSGTKLDLDSDKGVGLVKELNKPLIVNFQINAEKGVADVKDFELPMEID